MSVVLMLKMLNQLGKGCYISAHTLNDSYSCYRVNFLYNSI